MAKMNGCNDHMGGTKSDARAQGSNRMTPKSFARNNLSKGGVNKDLGGGATSGLNNNSLLGKLLRVLHQTRRVVASRKKKPRPKPAPYCPTPGLALKMRNAIRNAHAIG